MGSSGQASPDAGHEICGSLHQRFSLFNGGRANAIMMARQDDIIYFGGKILVRCGKLAWPPSPLWGEPALRLRPHGGIRISESLTQTITVRNVDKTMLGERRWRPAKQRTGDMAMARVKGKVVMAVLTAMAKAKAEGQEAKPERVATAWAFRMARLRVWS